MQNAEETLACCMTKTEEAPKTRLITTFGYVRAQSHHCLISRAINRTLRKLQHQASADVLTWGKPWISSGYHHGYHHGYHSGCNHGSELCIQSRVMASGGRLKGQDNLGIFPLDVH